MGVPCDETVMGFASLNPSYERRPFWPNEAIFIGGGA
jgi:hypothetical protein